MNGNGSASAEFSSSIVQEKPGRRQRGPKDGGLELLYTEAEPEKRV